MIRIPGNHKYATLALRTDHVTHQWSEPLGLGDDLWITGEMPVALPDHWQTWLGSLRVDKLREANLFLFSHRLAANPAVLDHENERLKEAVHRLYFSLLIAVPYIGHQDGTLMSGAHHDGNLDVRNLQPYDDVLSACGCHGSVLNDALFGLAKQVYDGLVQIEGAGEHSRIWRIIRAFYTALQEHQFGARIHQFVRCIEGFVFPDEGRTRNQMTSRSELFLGPTQHTLIQTLFDIRSAVEHLHGPARVVNDPNPHEADLQLAEYSFKSEVLAHYCLKRLFTTPTLWPQFRDDARLGAFWQLPAPRRAALWGTPLDLGVDFAHFTRYTASLQLS
ncbi:MAG TPA: hypothetical protein VGQ52_06165 [Gemmatimonadaceae bacterium]|nr:hypothetical protein [Gemmatimonadaceae bacterium]